MPGAGKHSSRDALVGEIAPTMTIWVTDPGVKTYQATPDQVLRYVNDVVLTAWCAGIESRLKAPITYVGGDPSQPVNTAKIGWPYGTDGDLALISTDPDRPHLPTQYTATYPDYPGGLRTITITITWRDGVDIIATVNYAFS